MSRRSSSSSRASRSSSFAAQLVCVAAAVGLVAGGCTHTRVQMVAKYLPGTPARVGVTPDVGVYKIKYAAGSADEEMRTLHGSRRFLGKGQPLGFVPGDAGTIIAVAGEERFPAKLPADARFCVWYTKTEEPSALGADVGDFAQTVLLGAVGVAVVGAMVVIALDDDDDECRHGYDEDECSYCCD